MRKKQIFNLAYRTHTKQIVRLFSLLLVNSIIEHNFFNFDTKAISITHKSKLPQIDPEALNNIEIEVVHLAKEFVKLNKILQTSLNNISAASVCSVQTFEEVINKNCEVVENSLKEEKTFLIKAKELSRTMEPIYKLQEKINSIKTVITTLESQI